MDPLYITYPLEGLLMIALGIGLGIFLTRKWKLGWFFWLIGAAAFVASQVGHIPFNAWLTRLFSRGVLPTPPEEWHLVFNSIVLGFSAGIWEQAANAVAFHFWAKEARSWRKGLLLGAGHGGIEAIILGGLVLYSFLQALALRDPGALSMLPPEQAAVIQQRVTAFWSVPWWMPFLGAVERVFAITMHVAASVLVLQMFLRRQVIWLVFAIALHAFADGLAVFASSTWGIYVTFGLLSMTALISLGIIFALRQPEPVETPPEVVSPSLPESPPVLSDIQETPENLEKTRFS